MKCVEGVVGILLEFDDFVSMVLEGVTEFETTPEGRAISKLELIWLNGNNSAGPWRKRT